MRFKNIYTAQETHAVFYDGDNVEEVCEKLPLTLIKKDEFLDKSAMFRTPYGELSTKANRWLYIDPNENGIWTLKDENFRKIWIPEDEDPKKHLPLYVDRERGTLRAAVQFDGTNALVIVHMFPHVSSFVHDSEAKLLIIDEEKDGNELRHKIPYWGWVTSSMYGDWYYPIQGANFNDKFVKLEDNFGKKD